MKFYIVDTFADRIFKGNPAGVCVLDRWLPAYILQKIANEHNLETVFAVSNGNDYDLRFFSPKKENEISGHPILAVAYILTRFYEPDRGQFVFHTRTGTISARKLQENFFEIGFPREYPEEIELTSKMVRALDLIPSKVLLSRDLIFLFENERDVRQYRPDYFRLERLDDGQATVLTAPGRQYDFVLRGFYPRYDVYEDHVSAAIHSALTPFWAKRLGKTKLVSRQLSTRGGTIYSEDKEDSVLISGEVALYLEGWIYI